MNTCGAGGRGWQGGPRAFICSEIYLSGIMPMGKFVKRAQRYIK
jgi:hypothetical protein